MGTRVVEADCANLVFKLEHTSRWYTPSSPPIRVRVPTRLLLHVGFNMAAAELPPHHASKHQKEAVAEGAVVLDEDDHEEAMQELAPRIAERERARLPVGAHEWQCAAGRVAVCVRGARGASEAAVIFRWVGCSRKSTRAVARRGGAHRPPRRRARARWRRRRDGRIVRKVKLPQRTTAALCLRHCLRWSASAHIRD